MIRSGPARDRGGLIPDPRSFHVELAGQRSGASAHVVFRTTEHGASDGVLILRIPHEAMDPRSRLLGVLD